MAGEGESDVSIYAWPKGEGERVCVETSFGSGGCFAKFLKGEFFNVTESDPDRVGHGTPLLVWGVVPDRVVGVTVVAQGRKYEATVKNNAVVFEMPDSSLGYSAIASFIVQLSDGSSQVIKN
jgi:hypothetical protein